MRTLLLIAVLLIVPGLSVRAAEPGYLYNARFVQAAPGRLLELIDTFKKQSSAWAAAGDEAPLIIRHTQGDKWDLRRGRGKLRLHIVEPQAGLAALALGKDRFCHPG